MKTVRRPPYPKWNPGYFPCSSLTPLPLSSRRPSVSFGGFGFRLWRWLLLGYLSLALRYLFWAIGNLPRQLGKPPEDVVFTLEGAYPELKL